MVGVRPTGADAVSERRHRPPIRLGDPPTPGWFKRRLVRNGPWVGCQITLDADGYRVMQDGVWQGPAADPWSIPLLHEVFTATPCTEADVLYIVGLKQWAKVYAPEHAAANPRLPIDPGKLPVVY